jgi:hypothetical protein
MSTPTKAVKLQLDRMRSLRYTNRSLMKVEDETGRTVMELAERLNGGSLLALTALVWCGLIHEDPELMLETVGDLVDLTRVAEIGEAVNEAIAIAFSKPDPDKPEPESESPAKGKAKAARRK